MNKGAHRMTYKEFLDLHAECITAMRAYFAEAEQSCVLLAQCTVEPLSPTSRLNLIAQEVAEKEAHGTYLDGKRLLHEAALQGYGSSNCPSTFGRSVGSSND
jgi:hypothetical protein